MKQLVKVALSLGLMFGLNANAELSTEQKDAVTKLQAKGGLVLPIAANNDSLSVSLSTAGKAAGDAELALVKMLPKVEQLDLRNTSITSAGLANIAGLTTITNLHLEGTAVTDDGLAHIKNLNNLTYLNVYNTAVTDKGIGELGGLKNLKRLYLWQTKVTDAGVTGLKKSLPDLYVNRGEDLTITTQPAPAIPPAAPKKDKKKPEAAKPTVADATKAIEAPAGTKAINTKCPVSGKDVDATKVSIYGGKAVGLCCEKCQAKFVAEPAKFMAKVVADAK